MTQDTPSRHLDQFMLRLPGGMRDRLKAEAEASMRSMNAEIVARLQVSLDDDHDLPSVRVDLMYSVAQAAAEETTHRLLEVFVETAEGELGIGKNKQIERLKAAMQNRLAKYRNKAVANDAD